MFVLFYIASSYIIRLEQNKMRLPLAFLCRQIISYKLSDNPEKAHKSLVATAAKLGLSA